MAFIGNQPFGKTVRSTSTETLTSVKTAFYPAGGYTVGYVDVFLNGSKLTEVSDFTATNGSLVTLLFNPEIGDTVEIVTYGSVEIANAVRRSGDTISGSLGASSFTVGSDFIANSTAITTTSNTVTFGTSFYSVTNGNVGIGTSSPRNFEVSRSDANTIYGSTAAQFPINVRNTDTTANNWAVIGFNQGASSYVNPAFLGAQFVSSSAASLVFGTSSTERARIDSSGRFTLASQPFFYAYLSVAQTGYNASSTGDVPVIYNATTTNTGSHYNTSTGKFTAPVAGNYIFYASAYSTGTTFPQNWLIVNGSRIVGTDWVVGTASNMSMGFWLIRLAANDTVGFHAYNGAVTNATIATNQEHTYFKGCLLG